jgi:hypothetical protein
MSRVLAILAFLLLSATARAVPLTTQPNLPLLLSTCAAHAPVAGNVSGQPMVCDTLSAMMDSAYGSAQGDILYRNATVWTVLTPGTSGQALTTQGASANPQWATVGGGTGCTISGGSVNNLIVNSGSSSCLSNANASANGGALSLGQAGTAGTVQLFNATTGSITLGTVTGALGNVTASFPANTGVVSELNLAQTWTAAQTFTNSDWKLLGSSTGATTFTSANASASNFTITVPGATDTLAVLGTVQTWTALQTYDNSDIAMLGSSTGKTTLTSANSGASNFTITVPAVTDTLAVLGTAQTWTALQTYNASDIAILGSSTGKTTLATANAGASNFTATLPANTGNIAETNLAQTWSAAQAFNNADLVMNGSSSGTTALEANATAGTTVATFPANTGIVAELNLAQTFSALQTFNNSDIAIVGSSTGTTTLASANAGASNFTLTLPAVTDTVAVLGTANQNMTGGVLTPGISIGTESSGTYTAVCGNGPLQWLTNGGAFTLAAPANDSACIIKVVNNGSAGAISFSGFSVGSNTGDALDTVNGHKFFIWVGRDAGDSTYSVKALQ